VLLPLPLRFRADKTLLPLPLRFRADKTLLPLPLRFRADKTLLPPLRCTTLSHRKQLLSRIPQESAQSERKSTPRYGDEPK